MSIKRIVKVTNDPIMKFSNTSSVKETKFLIFIAPFLLLNKFNTDFRNAIDYKI